MKPILHLVAALACLRSAAVDAATLDDVRTVGLQGGQIPGEPAGVTFFRLNSPTINNQGEVVFRTLLGGVGANPASDVGIFFEGTSAGPGLIVREGESAPGSIGAQTFEDMLGVFLNNRGEAAFASFVRGPGIDATNNQGVWIVKADGSLMQVAQTGVQAPGFPTGVVFQNIAGNFNEQRPIRFNDRSQVAMTIALAGPGINSDTAYGGWIGEAGSLPEHLVQSGQASPNGPAGTKVYMSFLHNLNDDGLVAFDGVEIRPPSQVLPSTLWTASTVQPAEPLQMLPQTTYSNGVINDHGVAVVSTFNPPAQRVTYKLYPNGTTQPLLGASGGAEYRHMLINAHDRAAILAEGDNFGNNETLYVENAAGQLRTVAKSGDSSPYLASHERLDFYTTARNVAFNDLGQVAFWTYIRDDNTGQFNGRAIWATDVAGALHMLMRTGDQIDVDDSLGVDLRTINDFFFLDMFLGSLSSTQGGGWSNFNNRGQLSLRLDFTDDTHGVFVFNQVAVPEPATLVVCLCSHPRFTWQGENYYGRDVWISD